MRDILRITIFITALIIFGNGIYLSYLGKTAGATVTYTAAVLCLVFSFLQEFKKFKGLGIEAELLEKKIEEADKVLSQLRDLIKPISELLFTMVARGGRWDSAFPRKDSYRLMMQFEKELRDIGVSEEEISDSQKEWHQFNLLDLSRPIVETVHNYLLKKGKEQQANIQAFKQPITSEDQPAHKQACEEARLISQEQKKNRAIYSLEDRHSAHDEIVGYIDTCYLIKAPERERILAECQEQLKDLKYYTEKHKFRRLDVWFSEKE